MVFFTCVFLDFNFFEFAVHECEFILALLFDLLVFFFQLKFLVLKFGLQFVLEFFELIFKSVLFINIEIDFVFLDKHDFCQVFIQGGDFLLECFWVVVLVG